MLQEHGMCISSRVILFLVLVVFTPFLCGKTSVIMNKNINKDDEGSFFKNVIANNALVEKIKSIKLIICDVDGALTDATILVTEQGEFGRAFSIQDGHAFAPAMKSGLKIAIVSGKAHGSTLARAKKLGIPEMLIIQGVSNKVEAFDRLVKEYQLQPNEILVYGDDVLDAQIKTERKECFFVCPANAVWYIKPCADLVLPLRGGTSAFRMVLDLWLYLNKKHFAQSLIECALQ